MGLSRTVSEIDGDFGRKSQNFPTHPRVFCAAAEGFPFSTGYRRWGVRKLKLWGYRADKEV